MQVNFETFKTNFIPKHSTFLLRLGKVQHDYSSTNAYQALFWVKSIGRLFFKFMKPYDFLPILIKYYCTQ